MSDSKVLAKVTRKVDGIPVRLEILEDPWGDVYVHIDDPADGAVSVSHVMSLDYLAERLTIEDRRRRAEESETEGDGMSLSVNIRVQGDAPDKMTLYDRIVSALSIVDGIESIQFTSGRNLIRFTGPKIGQVTDLGRSVDEPLAT